MSDEYYGKTNTFQIVGTMIYLIGVRRESIAANSDLVKIYDRCAFDKPARIVHNLCLARSSIERAFKDINNKMRDNFSSIFSANPIVGQCMTELSSDGVYVFTKSKKQLAEYIIELNALITDRINNCKNMFPDWINWLYIRDLFIMPNGNTIQGTKDAADRFYTYQDWYPYRSYINWIPRDEGNILYNDSKFVTLLYSLHNDYFEDPSKVKDAGDSIKANIYDFIEASNRTTVLVDCENSDPYRLCSTFQSLDEEYTAKISKIILIDDPSTTVAWSIFDQITEIPVERVGVTRLMDRKSLVDMTLAMRASKEFYVNGVDSFVIVSSDSDYWALINNLEAKYMVLVEREKFSNAMECALEESGIYHCYIEDFYGGNSTQLQTMAVMKEVRDSLNDMMKDTNLKSIISKASTKARAALTDVEFNRLYERVARDLVATVGKDGQIGLEVHLKTKL